MSHRILDTVDSPLALKHMTDEQLEQLAAEIRQEILLTTSRTGGHVAPSLGVVELILVIHSLLDTPSDKLLFDVGHQAYAHKLITGRLQQFSTLRQYGGLSGFPKAKESPYDVHPSGHASDSISVALGMALARDLRGGHKKIVSLIGDAGISGGMAFEALNHAGQLQTPLVVILNDNEMSISRSVGALASYLGNKRASKEYMNARDGIQSLLESRGEWGAGLVDFGRNVKDSIKHLIMPDEMIFEKLGFLCTVPIDGHNIPLLRRTLQAVFDAEVPALVHVVTKKGKGYSPAEKRPDIFHGVGPFDLATGKVKKSSSVVPTYTEAFAQALIKEAQHDTDIVAITAAMPAGTGLSKFAERFPDRFIDTGIAEEHAVGLASGLALAGKKPVVAIYSTFMQRAFDQLIIDNALAGTNVVFCLDRAGLVGDDGPTHHGVFDIAYMRMVPNVRVLTPSDEVELADMLHTALQLEGPVVIRYPRGQARGVQQPHEPCMLPLAQAKMLKTGDKIALLAFGRMVQEAEHAADMLEEQGLSCAVYDMRWVKPFDTALVERLAQSCELIVTLEEGVIQGGVGEAICAHIAQLPSSSARVVCMGIPDRFIEQGKIALLHHDLMIDAEGIASRVKKEAQLREA